VLATIFDARYKNRAFADRTATVDRALHWLRIETTDGLEALEGKVSRPNAKVVQQFFSCADCVVNCPT
jgi:hypothetical protein